MCSLSQGTPLQNGRYEIKAQLGSPSGKDVYWAYDRDLDCEVTLDVFSNNYAMPKSVLPVAKWEARVLNKLGDHRNIARHHGYWEEHDGVAVMATHYLPGGRLEQLIARTRAVGESLAVQRVLQLSTELADGLAYIHQCRLLYLDLQPHNVLFDERGTPRLVDFDTAVSLDTCDIVDLSHRPVVNYMAPEVLQSQVADARADLYSLGATIYEMAAGHPPFAGNREEILAARRAGPPLPLDREDLPESLRDLIFCLLVVDREQRPSRAVDVLKRLEGISATRADIERLLTNDESARLELKATLRVPIAPPKPTDKRSPTEIGRVLEREVIETMAAFLNTDGGTLIIGVTDDRKIVGIEVDYPRVQGSRDGWRLTFDHLVTRDLGAEVMKSIDLQLEPWNGHTIAVVRCLPHDEPTWIGDELYVRCMASTEKLSTRHAVAWWRQRWS